MSKKIYSEPKFEDVGSFETLTKGNSASPLLDNNQQAGTVPVVGFS